MGFWWWGLWRWLLWEAVKLSPCPMWPNGSNRDLPLSKAKPSSDSGSDSGITESKRGGNHLQLHPEKRGRIGERNSPADPKGSAEGGTRRMGPTKTDPSTNPVTVVNVETGFWCNSWEKVYFLFSVPIWRLEATGLVLASLCSVSSREWKLNHRDFKHFRVSRKIKPERTGTAKVEEAASSFMKYFF